MSAELVVLPFGKYRGQTLGEIADADIEYLDWLVGQDWFVAKRQLAAAVGEILLARGDQVDRAMGLDRGSDL